MVEHLVLFKVKADTSEDAIQAMQNALRGLQEAIPGILEITVGANFSERSQGFTHGLLVRFPRPRRSGRLHSPSRARRSTEFLHPADRRGRAGLRLRAVEIGRRSSGPPPMPCNWARARKRPLKAIAERVLHANYCQPSGEPSTGQAPSTLTSTHSFSSSTSAVHTGALAGCPMSIAKK